LGPDHILSTNDKLIKSCIKILFLTVEKHKVILVNDVF